MTGDKPRPTNWDHFSENFDRIFGKKNSAKDSTSAERPVAEPKEEDFKRKAPTKAF